MSYVVFARKYRPQTFDDIAGQDHITTTLRNAISQDKVAHAYLFAGPRGVGKTTTARIFAKSLNCEKGPTAKPCNACASCKEITQGTSLDILEIDGASNRGIDEIRALRENVKFSPSRGAFKVYIIDEVHMLTPEAFNALLKTLEEPPPHVKFIFATTQAHKVPATILSRCQRFDFRRIRIKDILKNLKTISSEERLDVKDEALNLIAKYSDGSMRDAQVILDQIASYSQGVVAVDDVTKMLGMVEPEILFGLSKAIHEKDALAALDIIDRLVSEGKDVFYVVLALIEHFRNLSVIKISKDSASLIEAGPEKLKRYEEESGNFTIEEILYIIYTLSNTLDFIRKSSISKIPFEAALIKLTLKTSIASLNELMDRIAALEKDSCKADVMPPIQEKALPVTTAAAKEVKKSETPASADLEEVLSSWASVINHIKTKKMSIASYLQEGYPIALEANVLLIGFSKEFQFHKDVLDSPDNRDLIEEAIKVILKIEPKVSLVLTEPANIEGRNNGKEDYPEKDASYDTGEKDAEEKKALDPIVKSALEIFGGEIAARSVKKAGAK